MSESNLKVSKANEMSELNDLTVGSTVEPSFLEHSPKLLTKFRLGEIIKIIIIK